MSVLSIKDNGQSGLKKASIVASMPLPRSELKRIRGSLLRDIVEDGGRPLILSVGLSPATYMKGLPGGCAHFLDLSGSQAEVAAPVFTSGPNINSIMIGVNKILQQVLAEDRGARCVVFIDDFDMLTLYNSRDGVARFTRVLTDRLRRAGLGGVFILTSGVETELVEAVHSVVDRVVDLG